MNRREGAEEKGPASYIEMFSLKLVRRRIKKKKNQG